MAENLLTKLAHKAETTLVKTASAQFQELSVEYHHDLNIYQPEINLAKPFFLQSNVQEGLEENQHTEQNEDDVEHKADELAESTVAKTAMEMIEQIIDELYDSCLKPEIKKNENNITKSNVAPERITEEKETVVSGHLNKSNEDASYGANETSRLLNSSSDDELERDHVVPDYIRFKEEGNIKQGSDANSSK